MSDFENKVKEVMNTKDTSNDYTKEDKEKNKGMAILSYILFFIPLITGDHKKSPYVKFHTNQGTILWITAIGYSIIYNILTSIIKVNGNCGAWFGYSVGGCRVTPWWVTLPLSLISLVIGIVGIIGVINAATGKTKELPVIGKYKIIK